MAVAWCCKAFLTVVIISIYFLQCATKQLPPWAKAKGHGHQGTYDGDIILDETTLRRLQNPYKPNPETRNLIKSSTYHWPNGVVPYVFEDSFDPYPHERTMILAAIGEVHKRSCVRFQLRTTEQYYIAFKKGTGCSSYVGRLQMAAQVVSIGEGCANIGTILHELLHVLGFFHTSSRTDRDSYVVVKNANVASGYEHNFWKLTADQVDHLRAPYEINSLMHPPRQSWSKNGQNTVESKKGSNVVLGNTHSMTDIDVDQLNTLYQCSTSQYPVCFQTLGMEDGSIHNSKLAASSSKTYHAASQARLNLKSTPNGNGAWCPSSPQAGQYLQIDFGSYKYINGIATQGFVSAFGSDSWVTNYNIHFSYDGSYWYDYATWYPSGLSANYDGSSIQYNTLPYRISTRYLRIIPTAWHSDMCMRVEVYGCNYY